MPKSRLRQLLKFMRVFGIAGGIRLWFALLLQYNSKLLKLPVPGLAAPIHLRPTDLPIFWQILVMQENDFDSLPQASRVKEAYKAILSEGHKPVIVDCGGHIGTSAIWFASRFPEAVVYSIEPNDSNFSLLQKNTAAYKNVSALNGGIWNRTCCLEIENPLAGSASFRLREVPVDTPGLLRGYSIDELAHCDPANHLFLVKMDIEGAEAQVFQGPAEWLESTTVLIIELHDWLMPGQGTSRNFFKRLAEHSFDVILRGENLLLFRVPDAEATRSRPLDTQVMATRH